MKKIVLFYLLSLLAVTQLYAQRAVSGKVIDSKDGSGLPGATVAVKGETIATKTDGSGNFSINVPANAVLVVSMVNYRTQEYRVGTSLSVTIALDLQSRELSEVVVTALGVSREKKSLGYSTTTIKNDEINRVAPVSIFDGLQGKVAGADISSVSGSPGGSGKVILRGYSSMAQGNQPLYVIDGVIVSDVRPGNEAISPDNATNKGTVPGYDFGNQANDINPSDIESISVLKGAAATSLYGSRASSGVIIITTKKGKAGKIKVDFNSSLMLSSPGFLPKLQERFGQGWDGRFWASENGSWGPLLDGKDRLWGASVDNSQLLKPFAFVKGGIRNLYDVGQEWNNAVSVSGGNESSTFFLSYGNVYNDGFLPTDNDSYKRNTLSLRGSTKYKRFSAEASFNYVNKYQKSVEAGQSASGVGGSFYEQVLQIPVDIPIEDLRNYKNKFFDVDNYFTPFAENPYYILYENGARQKSDRFYGNINLQYKVADWLTLQAQQGADITNGINKIWRNKNNPTPGSWNAGANPESAGRSANKGNVQEGSQYYYEYDSKLNLLFKKQFHSDFSLDGVAGLNYNERGSRVLYTYVEDLAIGGFFDISNGKSVPKSATATVRQAIAGLYGSATVGYKNYLYLTLNARNDWSSTLPRAANSYFYPSANVSFLLSNVFNIGKTTPLSYAKIRASYGKTGKDAPPYTVFDEITAQSVGLPFGQIDFPFNGIAGYTVLDRLGNQKLKPEISTEAEVGGEFKLWDDRIGFDIAYYRKISDGQIFTVPIAPSTGYTSVTLNFAKVRNQGIELSAHVMPVRAKNFTWDMGYVFTRNRNEVLNLSQGLDRVDLQSAFDAFLVAKKGLPLGSFNAPVPKTTPDGRIIVDPNTGRPLLGADDGYYGSAQRDFTMGLTNSVTYKNFRLGFSFDYRKGGVFYSSTSQLLLFTGNHYMTTYNDRNPFIIPNSVNEVMDPNTGKVIYVENTTAISESNVDDFFNPNTNKNYMYQHIILDKTFLKLRDVTLSYTLPNSVAKKISADRIVISLIGRNLVTWLPKTNRIIDPESSNFGRDLASEFGEFRVGPTARTYGVSLKVTF